MDWCNVDFFSGQGFPPPIDHFTSFSLHSPSFFSIGSIPSFPFPPPLLSSLDALTLLAPRKITLDWYWLESHLNEYRTGGVVDTTQFCEYARKGVVRYLETILATG